eukprot:gene4725-4974_t
MLTAAAGQTVRVPGICLKALHHSYHCHSHQDHPSNPAGAGPQLFALLQQLPQQLHPGALAAVDSLHLDVFPNHPDDWRVLQGFSGLTKLVLPSFRPALPHQQLPSIAALTQLQKLTLSVQGSFTAWRANCAAFASLSQLTGLQQLTLHAFHCPGAHLAAAVRQMRQLEVLQLSGRVVLEPLVALTGLSRLHMLELTQDVQKAEQRGGVEQLPGPEVAAPGAGLPGGAAVGVGLAGTVTPPVASRLQLDLCAERGTARLIQEAAFDLADEGRVPVVGVTTAAANLLAVVVLQDALGHLGQYLLLAGASGKWRMLRSCRHLGLRLRDQLLAFASVCPVKLLPGHLAVRLSLEFDAGTAPLAHTAAAAAAEVDIMAGPIAVGVDVRQKLLPCQLLCLSLDCHFMGMSANVFSTALQQLQKLKVLSVLHRGGGKLPLPLSALPSSLHTLAVKKPLQLSSLHLKNCLMSADALPLLLGLHPQALAPSVWDQVLDLTVPEGSQCGSVPPELLEALRELPRLSHLHLTTSRSPHQLLALTALQLRMLSVNYTGPPALPSRLLEQLQKGLGPACKVQLWEQLVLHHTDSFGSSAGLVGGAGAGGPDGDLVEGGMGRRGWRGLGCLKLVPQVAGAVGWGGLCCVVGGWCTGWLLVGTVLGKRRRRLPKQQRRRRLLG